VIQPILIVWSFHRCKEIHLKSARYYCSRDCQSMLLFAYYSVLDNITQCSLFYTHHEYGIISWFIQYLYGSNDTDVDILAVTYALVKSMQLIISLPLLFSFQWKIGKQNINLNTSITCLSDVQMWYLMLWHERTYHYFFVFVRVVFVAVWSLLLITA